MHILTHEFARVQVIGSGQFGEVWVGLMQDKRVAIKTNKEDNMLAVTEFFYEGEIMVNFNHPNIVQVCLSLDYEMIMLFPYYDLCWLLFCV